jgi:hypothetical protein
MEPSNCNIGSQFCIPPHSLRFFSIGCHFHFSPSETIKSKRILTIDYYLKFPQLSYHLPPS